MPATATVKGGFFETNGVPSLTQAWGYNSIRRRARQALSKYGQMSVRARMSTLLGTAPGAASGKQLSRVVASDELGGLRPIEQYQFINRNTTAADVTEIQQTLLLLSSKTYNPTPVANRDGNPLGTR